MSEYNCIINAMIVSVLLGFVVPRVLLMFTDPDKVKQPLQMDHLSEKDKLIHLMAHHIQLPLLTSVIIAIVVGLSVYLGYQLKPYNKLMGK
tara:strand:- start:319 stop:591 length:273 start_codon:yes stop_codon:yes gene_type:complete